MSHASTAVLEPIVGGPPGSGLPPSGGDDGSGRPRQPHFDPPVSNARIGMLAFILFESMLFAGLLGGFIILRVGNTVWPPPGQPRLPIAVTWINTIVLLGSFLPLYLAKRGFRGSGSKELGTPPSFVRGLLLSTVLGATFLVIQGSEWIRLIAHGLTVQKGVYGGSFLLLIGMHGLHVLGAVVWLGVLTGLAFAGRLSRSSAALDLVTLYWAFVCLVWIVLFGIVYLA